MVFGVSYDEDIRVVKAELQKIIAEDERVLAEPAPVIEVMTLGDSSVDFIVRPWVNTADYWQVLWDTNAKVKLRFDEVGITIPYPQMDIHVDSGDSGDSKPAEVSAFRWTLIGTHVSKNTAPNTM